MKETSNLERSLWKKVKGHAKSIGADLIYKALLLFYAALGARTPRWAKTTIYGALAYLISPIDAIPDLTPLLGYSDDFGILVAALAAVAIYIDENVHERARAQYKKLFNEDY